jgi:N-hydroxyarylamine O-acetyltransferase
MIDLDAYFQRIAYAGPREPALHVLTAICAAHPAAIPFENIDPFLGRPPSLDPKALQDKLVAKRRGGYCYEQNALLRLALLACGMKVTSHAARVVWMSSQGAPPTARSHMLLSVELPGEPGAFLADAGFGGHLLRTPLRLEPGLVQHTPTGVERISIDSTGDAETLTLETLLPAGWSPLYRFNREALLPVDYEPLNWYTATRPGAMFAHNLRLERLTEDLRASVLNDRLTLRPVSGESIVRRIDTATDLAEALDRIFDIEPPVPADELFARVPKGLDGVWTPPPD